MSYDLRVYLFLLPVVPAVPVSVSAWSVLLSRPYWVENMRRDRRKVVIAASGEDKFYLCLTIANRSDLEDPADQAWTDPGNEAGREEIDDRR